MSRSRESLSAGEEILTLDDAVLQEIQEIIGQMKCPKAFKCAETGFALLCKAKDSGLEGYLECLEEHPALCKVCPPVRLRPLLRVPPAGVHRKEARAMTGRES